VPLLVVGAKVKAGTDLGTRETFADVAQTTAILLGLESMDHGNSFDEEVLA
jgi:phosphopentomutase